MNTSVTPVTQTGTVVLLNSVAEGDDVNNRIGRKVNVKQIDIMYHLVSTAIDSAQVALVYDSQPNASNATYSQIFDLTASNPAGMAFKNTATFNKRFKVFWMDQQPDSDGSADPTNYIDRKRHFIKVPEAFQQVKYAGTTATTPNTGAWYLVFGAVNNTTTTMNIRYTCKFQYTDM